MKAEVAFQKSKPISYFLDLFLLRNPQDRITLSLPCNTYPQDGVKVRHARWDDGTQTFSSLMPDANNTTCYIKHIFTGNLPHLQGYTEEWLKNIQQELDIVRKPGDNSMSRYASSQIAADNLNIGPYFSYSANFCKDRNRPYITKSTQVPDCVNQIKDRMVSRAKLYAQIKEEDFRIDRLDILAWVTNGSKKARLFGLVLMLR